MYQFDSTHSRESLLSKACRRRTTNHFAAKKRITTEEGAQGKRIRTKTTPDVAVPASEELQLCRLSLISVYARRNPLIVESYYKVMSNISV